MVRHLVEFNLGSHRDGSIFKGALIERDLLDRGIASTAFTGNIDWINGDIASGEIGEFVIEIIHIAISEDEDAC